jgi:nitrate reductase cytochrome c-type subunit
MPAAPPPRSVHLPCVASPTTPDHRHYGLLLRRLVAVALVVAMVASGCSGQSEDKEETEESAQTTSTTTPALTLPRYRTEGIRLAVSNTEPLVIYNV